MTNAVGRPDVVVVGAGVSRLTTAVQLAEAGLRVDTGVDLGATRSHYGGTLIASFPCRYALNEVGRAWESTH